MVLVTDRVLAAIALAITLSCACATRYYKETKFSVPLDHFSFTRNDTFQIRYLLNDTYWNQNSNGPIFFYTGNEGKIETFAEHTGFIWDIAEEFNAMIVFAEHRYYGKSLPFGDKSYSDPGHLGYLSSQQALADYADLITYLSGHKVPVIAFGGSYGGMLSAYLRMKYPHVVAGAISASAPILQFAGMVPCDAFYRIASSAYNSANEHCYGNIKKSWAAIRNKTKTADGRKALFTEWKLCSELKNDTSVANLLDYLSEMYVTTAMVNYPYECDFLAALPAYPVRYMCQYLDQEFSNDTQLLQAIRKAIDVFTNYKGGATCFNYEASTYGDLGDEGWDFQSCTEMVMPMCPTGVNDMFEAQPWNEKDFSDNCQKKWHVSPQENLAYKEYGGIDIVAASNIIFSNGLLDPWASGGVLRDLSRSLKAILIPEGAHHLDLMGANANDPYSVKVARKFHKKNIRQWIKDFRIPLNAGTAL